MYDNCGKKRFLTTVHIRTTQPDLCIPIGSWHARYVSYWPKAVPSKCYDTYLNKVTCQMTCIYPLWVLQQDIGKYSVFQFCLAILQMGKANCCIPMLRIPPLGWSQMIFNVLDHLLATRLLATHFALFIFIGLITRSLPGRRERWSHCKHRMKLYTPPC